MVGFWGCASLASRRKTTSARETRVVHVDTSDIRCSDHFLVWMEFGRACKLTKSHRTIIKKWCLDRFEVDNVRYKYQKALEDEMQGVSESIRQKINMGLKDHALVALGEVLREWESIVNRVAKREVRERMIVCGRSARWWDSEVKVVDGENCIKAC